MQWKHPPLIKIYEALGTVADGRIEVSENTAKVFSSNRNKFYTVSYNPVSEAIMANDNSSFYQNNLGYPAIAFLLKTGKLTYSPEIAEKLKGITWKDINTKFKNDFAKTLEFILQNRPPEDRMTIEKEVELIDKQLKVKSYSLLGKKTSPPQGY